jgi:NAD-dependent SIR2 family protein deacetylase
MAATVAVIDELARAIRSRRVILFAGAGLSMSVGLPSWSELAEHMADELRLPEDVLSSPGTTYQTLAEY